MLMPVNLNHKRVRVGEIDRILNSLSLTLALAAMEVPEPSVELFQSIQARMLKKYKKRSNTWVY